MKKKIIIRLSILVVLFIGYAVAGPYITVYQIKSAAKAHDGAALAEHIDFPALRGNLKQQIDNALLKKTGIMQSDNIFGLFAMGVASSLSDRIVNLLVTPSGIETLMTGTYPKALKTHAPQPTQETSAPATNPDNSTDEREPFYQARYTYDDLSTFSIWVKSDFGAEMRFVLTRDNITWKLSNIVIPF